MHKLFPDMSKLKPYPELWRFMRDAAYFRHAMLVYGMMGCNKYAHQEMYKHMRLVDKVYGDEDGITHLRPR
jgi:hypothetical protein